MQKSGIVALAVLGWVGCSKSSYDAPSDTVLTPDLSAPIVLNAAINVHTQVKAITGPVNGSAFPESTEDVFRLRAYAGASVPTDWSDAAIYDGMNDLQVNSGSSSELSLSTPKYYPSDASKKLYFYAWAPAAGSITAGGDGSAPVANYTLTGQEDILWAKDDRGIAKDVPSQSDQPALNFAHKLKQVKFKLVKDASFEEGQKVTSIKITQVKTSAKLDLSNGTLTFDGSADQELVYPIDTGTDDAITAEGTEMTSCVMFEPGATFTLSVTVGEVEYSGITVSLSDGGGAGNSYLVTLTFKRNDIVPTASITDWVPGAEAGVDIM